MKALCAALLLMTSPAAAMEAPQQIGNAEAEARLSLEDAAWAFAHWQGEVEAMAPGFGLDSPAVTTRWRHDERGVPGAMTLQAFAAPGGLTIELSGSGWRTPSQKARRLLTANAAHELAHLWQFRFGEAEAAPRWLHEGFAEALAAELTGPSSAAAHRGNAARCRSVLEEGPVRRAQRRGREEAVYDCGAVVIAAVAAAREETPSALYAAFAAAGFTEEAFLSLAEAAVPTFRRPTEAFLSRDWRHASPGWVMTQFRAGRL